MSKLNILFYTDHSSVADAGGLHSIVTLQQLLKSEKPAFVNALSIEVMNRFEDPQKPHKLTQALLAGFHEIWFFGKYQAKVNGEFNPQYGGLENELDDTEVKALGEWMKNNRGGILITGDHSQENLPNDGTINKKIFCRGRALGYRIPRARALRAWENFPTNETESSFNTLVGKGIKDPDNSPELQEDDTPQKLEFVRFGSSQSPHPLFLGKRKTIEIFPDHMHEGAAIAPPASKLSEIKDLLEDEWPKLNGTPHEPKLVAYGFDKRHMPPRSVGVIAVYDGDAVARGRIVADSSWHHYLDINLRKIGNDGDGSDLDLMAQFYRNLAVWLAPLDIRKAMSHEMFKQLAIHPEVEEEIGNSVEKIGTVALHHLSQVATRCEVIELTQAASPISNMIDGAPVQFSSARLGLAQTPSRELVTGSIINQFQRRAYTVRPLENSGVPPDPILKMSDEVLAAVGMSEAYRIHSERISEMAAQARSKHERYESLLKSDVI